MKRIAMALVGFSLPLTLSGCPGAEMEVPDVGVDVGAIPDDVGALPDVGRDAGRPDAFSANDAFGPDAFAADDAFVEVDAFVELDAFTPPDAFAPDAFVVPDAFTPPDARISCVGADCAAMADQCHIGSCGSSGMCEFANRPNGTLCADTHACSISDTCNTGTCSGTLACRVPNGLVAFGTVTNTAYIGSGTGGTLFEDPCDANEVLIGVSGTQVSAGGYLGSMRAICGAVTLSGSGFGPYSITASPGFPVPSHGLGTGGPAFNATCPANQVVVGFSGRGGTLVDQLVLRCAPLTVGETPTEFVPVFGAITSIAPVGGAGGAAFAAVDCGAGQVAAFARIRAGDGIDGFGLACKAARLTYPVRADAVTATARGGSAGGVAFADACPGGMLITGYTGRLHTAGYIGQIQASCQRFDVVGPLATPTILRTGGISATPARGAGTGAAWTANCPPGSSVVAFNGRGGMLVDQLVFECAPVFASAGGIVGFGPAAIIAPVGGGGGAPFARIACPAGRGDVQSTGGAGDGLDGFALGCAPLSY